MSVHVSSGFNMRPFQEQHHRLPLPLLRHIDIATIPGIANIVFVRCQEEGELHLSALTVFLHIGVKVV